MNLITHRFSLDLAKHGSQVVLNGFKTGDTNRAIDVSLAMNGIPYYLGAEHSAQIRMKIYTEEGPISIHDPCTIKDERVFYKINPAALSVAGTVTADIEIGTAGADIFSTARFVLFVTAGEGDDTQIPEEQYNSVITALANSELALKKTISTAAVTYAGNLVISFEDNTAIDAGHVVGPQGAKGEKGDKGEQGEQGEKGEIGLPDYNLVANALKGKAIGTAVSMTDVSPLEHNIGVKLASKNIFNPNSTIYNAYFKWADNGQELAYAYDSAVYIIPCLPNATYTFSHSNSANNIFRIAYIKAETIEYPVPLFAPQRLTTEKEATITTEEGATFIVVQLTLGEVENTKQTLQCEIGSTATAYTPYADLASVTLKTFGENLWDEEWRNGTYNATTGAFEARNDLVANANPIMVQEGETYTVNTGNINAFGYLEDGTLKYPNTTSKGDYTTITITSGIKYINFGLGSAYGNVYKNDLCIRKENAERNTLYVPYEGRAYSGTVESVTSLYPTTTLMTDTAGVTISAEYNRDLNKAFAEIYQAIATMGAAPATIPEEV